MRGRVHTRDFKLEVCRQVANGEKRPAQICREVATVRSQGLTSDDAFSATITAEYGGVELSLVEASAVVDGVNCFKGNATISHA